MKNLSYLLTLFGIALFVSCNKISNANPINDVASLPSSFGFDARHQKVVALFFDKKNGTIATLYGNDFAFDSASNSLHSHVAGEVYTMVTWKYEANPQWFGGTVPGELQEVEVLKLVPSKDGYIKDYSRYLGKYLVLDAAVRGSSIRANEMLHQRTDYMLSQRAALFL